jgi:hypothetical protein
MRVAVVLARGLLPNRTEQIPPFGAEGIGSDLEAVSELAEALEQALVESDAIFAEAINARACKQETSPAAGILDFLVPTPDCSERHIIVSYRRAESLRWR